MHVERQNFEAKFWIDPVRFARSHGFSPNEVNRIEELIIKHQHKLQASWDEFFNG